MSIQTQSIVVLGSTGSIGTQTLEIVDKHPESFRVVALSAGRNLGLLREQIMRFKPHFVSVERESDALALKKEFPSLRIGFAERGLCEAAEEECDTVVVGVVGFAALKPTLKAVRLGRRVALANKESLVVAGWLLTEEAKTSGAHVIPVDSEHNALYQLLEKVDRSQVASIVLTASGGPLLRKPEISLDLVTPAMAVAHPNWKMGPKISVDSATLMNKGLELIEAHFLFNFPSEQIEVWIHPQSIVHGAIWTKDNSCFAQMSRPNMKSSLGYALAYPDRIEGVIPKMAFKEFASLEFFAPDTQRFPCLSLARNALVAGPSHLVALNAANEIAVEAFLVGKILFSRIPGVIMSVLESHQRCPVDSLEAIYAADEDARRVARSHC